MKHLYIIRHATAVSPGFGSDYERKLDYTSIPEIDKISNLIKSKGWNLQLLLCSSAWRTKETAEKLAPAFGYDPATIHLKDKLYNAPFENYVDQIIGINDDVEHLGLVGHNPGISHLVSYFSSDKRNYNLPTCGLVHLQFKISHWQEVSLGSGLMLDYIIP